MANTYAATVLQDARAFITDPLNKQFELRPNYSNVLRPFLDGAAISIPRLEEIKKATTQTTTALFFTDKDFTINGSKSCTPSGETGGTDSVNLTWTQAGFAVLLEDKKFHGNEVSKMQALAMNLYTAEKKFWFGTGGIDATLVAYLEAQKTAANACDGGLGHNTWIGGGLDYMEVAAADIPRFYNYALAEMQLNNYDPELVEVANTLWGADRYYYMNQGGQNATNYEFQFPGFSTFLTNHIAPTAYYSSIHYLWKKGAVGFLTWNEMLNREGKVAGDRQWGTAQSLFFPEVTFDYYAYTACSDTTSNGGATQDLVTNLEFTLNYSIAKQPLSVANETPIFKYATL